MSRLIESILIPTDDSEGALAGAKLGVALASRVGADVHVLSVVERRDDLIDFGDDVALPSLEEQAEEATETVAKMAHDYDENLQVTTSVRQGTPFQSIREYASRREIDVIAMGTKGQTGLGRVLLGGVTENVLRTARKPVLAVPPEADVPSVDDGTFERLLLPTDGSDGATVATEWGIPLANLLGSTVHTLFSIEVGPFSGLPESQGALEELERRGEEAIQAVRERAADVDVTVSGSIETGPPVKNIHTYVIDHDVDLIVMGTHGRTGIGQWFLGSVTENVVRQVDVPVFCVPVSAETP